MLKRKHDALIEKFLVSEEHKLVLLIDGVQQSGKSTSVRENCKRLRFPLVELNFYFHPEYFKKFKKLNSIKELIDSIRLEVEDGVFIKGKTVIFFDEIQLFPELLSNC